MSHRVARIDARGRITIPASIRGQLGLLPGTSVTVAVRNGKIRLLSRLEAARRAQELVRRYVPAGRRLANELIAQRRGEIDRE